MVVEPVVILTNVPPDVINVIAMLAASMLLVVTVVNAMLVFKVMAEDATMLMSAPKIHAIITLYAAILLALSNAKNVRMVIMRMDPDVWILTNVHAVLINVIRMPDVKIQKVLILAVAILVSAVMAEPVVILTNVQQDVISVGKMHIALILVAVTTVLAMPVMKEMVELVGMLMSVGRTHVMICPSA